MHTHAPFATPGTVPEGWPTGEQVLAHLTADDALQQVIDEALAALDPDDILSKLQKLPPSTRAFVLREIGLQSAGSLNRGMTGQIVARIRNNSERFRSDLLRSVVVEVSFLLDAPLDAQQWTSLLGESSPADAMLIWAGARDSALTASFGVPELPPYLYDLALVTALHIGTAAAGLAGRELAARHERLRPAMQELQAAYPQLPTGSRTLLEVGPAARFHELPQAQREGRVPTMQEMGRFLDALADHHPDALALIGAPNGQGHRHHRHHSPPGKGRPDASQPPSALPDRARPGPDAELTDEALADLIDELESVLAIWPRIPDLSREFAEQVEAGRLEAEGSLVASFVEDVEQLHTVARRMLLAEGELEDTRAVRDDLTALLAHLHGQLRTRSQDQDTTWLTQLTQVQTPAATAALGEQVRERAQRCLDDTDDSASERSGLRALHALIGFGLSRRTGSAVDYDQVSAAEGAVRELLPELSALVMPAAFGDIAMPEAPTTPASTASAATSVDSKVSSAPSTSSADDDVSTDTVVTPARKHSERSDSGPASAVEPISDTAAGQEAAPDLTERPGAEALSGSDPERADLAPVAVDPVVAEVTTSDPVPTASHDSTDEGSTDDDDLAELDALLAAGHATELAGLTGRRKPPTNTSTPAAPAAPTSPPAPAAAPEPRSRRTKEATPAPTEPAPVVPTAELPSDDELSRTQASLLTSHRLGLAADLHDAAGGPAAGGSARRMAAYAVALRHATGPTAASFAAEAEAISRGELADDRAGQLLAWSAAARIAVLSPSAGPATVLLELAPTFSNRPALTETGQALADASRSGIVVRPDTADAVETLAQAEALAAELASHAADILDGTGNRVIKYVPANGVYQSWIAPTGPLGELLSQVARNDASLVSEVRDTVVELRSKAEKAIDDTFLGLRRQRNRNNKIFGGARGTLVTRWEETLDLAGQWADAAERCQASTAQLSTGTWQSLALAKLRNRLSDVRADALAELSAMQAEHASEPVTAAAALVAADLLNATFAICDGQAQTGQETAPVFTAHSELLATDLPLQASTLLPAGGLRPEHVAALTAQAQLGSPDWSEVYQMLAERGDHDLTATLIAGLRASDAAFSQALERQRSLDAREAGSAMLAQVDALVGLVDARRMAGTLDDAPWAALASRALALADPARRDYGRIGEEVASIRAELDTHLQTKVEQTIAQIQEKAENSPVVAAAVNTLTKLARDGQVASAEEYLEQAITGGELPTPDVSLDHLHRFFPAVPDLAVGSNLITDLRDALAGHDPAPSVTALQQITGTELTALSSARLDAARRALGAWASLNPARPGDASRTRVDVPSALRSVLAQAGLEFTDATLEPTSASQSGRRWITLRDVTGTGKALTPVLGSGMSPDGRTLRVLVVTAAPSPTTVLEWMSSELNDHTVMVLWTGAALSAAERRAVADAARGRTRPPVLFVDVAVLAYLVMQTEPRRSTLAALTLPFTALSPYKDTPGDTAPEMFYGRNEELEQIMDLTGPSVLSGGRQLGKSAALRMAARRFNAGGPQRRAILLTIFTIGADSPADLLWHALWPRLVELGIVAEGKPTADLGKAVHDGILAWIAEDDSRALLILLDEADAFLDADSSDRAFSNVNICRDIMLDSGRRAKFVFAGLHRTARFEAIPNQPLAHMQRPITIGPLRAQHAYDLLTRPLHAIGYRFADPLAIPARVLALANNMPALLQLFGAALVEHLTSQPVPADGPPQVITDDDIGAVLSNAVLLEAFREKYVLTLNLDHRYLVIAYVVAQAAHEHGADTSLSLNDLSATARASWPAGFRTSGPDDLRALVTECVDLGILAVDGASRYRLRTPTVLRLLGTEEEVLETLYSAPERLLVPNPVDAGSYRRKVRSSRSPLTERQLGQLLSPARAVIAINGSAALGADWLLAALEDASKEGAGRVGHITRCHTVTPAGVRHDIGRIAHPHAVVLVDARPLRATPLEDLLLAASEAVHDSGRDITVAVLTSPANAAGWVGWSQRLNLTRLDPAGLRLWCDDDGLPFRDETSREQLLEVTGGWPMLLGKVGDVTAGTVATTSSILDGVAALLGTALAGELVTASGLDQPVLLATFLAVQEMTGGAPEDLQTLVELIGMLSADDGAGLSRDGQPESLSHLLATAGFVNVAEAIEALNALACLSLDSEGMLSVEPVLAAAVQATTAEPAGADALTQDA